MAGWFNEDRSSDRNLPGITSRGLPPLIDDSEPGGCLAAILSLFGIRLRGPDASIFDPAASSTELPYRLRDDFLSAAERSFYQVLTNVVGNRAVVCCKVNLADLFFVPRSPSSQGYRNRIDRKHVDFLLCAPATMKPLCGIELDDSSHARADRQSRDEFVDHVFKASKFPLVRIPAKSSYAPRTLRTILEPHLSTETAANPQSQRESVTEPPLCPKCGIPMVHRTAMKGANAGKPFYGCSNYPKCSQIVAVEYP